MGLRASAVLWCLLAAAPAAATDAPVPVQEFQLPNGMRFLVVERPGSPMVAAGWVVRAGSGDERPPATGLSHLLEHLLFKGTRIIGSRDPDRERALMDRRSAIDERLRQLRGGEPATEAAAEALRRQAAEIERQLRAVQRKGEYALVYTGAGARGINALTREDLTVYYMRLPTPRLEVWFWMESDRLLHPVFRDFWSEKGVIDEEVRQRIRARPGGAALDRFRTAFWGPGHPYSWTSAGRAEDLAGLTLEAARTHFSRFYRPERLAAAFVGDVSAAKVRSMAQRYFGRLKASADPTPPDRTAPTRPPREVRIEDDCQCPEQVHVRYETVPFGHPDAVALEALAGLLNGSSGRLYRDLVSTSGVATSASSLHAALRRSGFFRVSIEGRSGVPAWRLEEAWNEEVSRLASRPPTVRELTKVKHRVTTDSFRQLKEPSELLLRLLIYEALGSWRHLESVSRATESLMPEDIRRVVRTYLTAKRRGVLLLHRRATP